LNNGALSADFEDIGGSGHGEFVQSGGTNETGASSSGLTIGVEASGNGSYRLARLRLRPTRHVGIVAPVAGS
jgi:hypothetical protein